MISVPGGKGLPLVDAGAAFLGKDTEIADQVVGRGETIDVHDLGDQGWGSGLPMPVMVRTWTCGEAGKSAKASRSNW